MAQSDLYNNAKAIVAIANQYATAATVTGATIDTQGFQGVSFAVNVTQGAGTGLDGSNNYAVQVFESDSSAMSGETQIAAASGILGTLPTISGLGHYEFGVISNKRYLRLKLAETGTASGQFYGVAVLGLPNEKSIR
jgi:hypothetical protein